MSPKKAHEVTQSLGYITQLFNTLGLDPRQVRIVDIGAGQGYLTRALHTHLGTTHLLALDSSEIQTQVGSITQKNIHITPASLCQAIDEWVAESSPAADPVPVFLVALHACGSLTPDLIRAFFIQRASRANGLLWNPVGMIAIGCCYNLLAPQGLSFNKSRADATLALRKIVWRAIIGARFAKVAADQSGPPDGTGDRPAMRRLGRLNNSVYDDWPTFAGVAGARLGVDLGGPDVELDAEEQALSRELEVLHVLRCIIGPLVESVIIMDREEWVREQLGLASELRVEAVNLFDQATGSGRNVALVVAPLPPAT
ncbi:methyltransferase domain-containing protein [Roridomyces roridus]|uniref:Methyltransferase domain-containing protein n=1 Tax=Roridomyces roridus TaxID=1738132 RepID=A0AAD7CBA3_9AGAR|nr:methyltransferase domain-containing protein [Roridomyces roridus]